MAEQSHLIDAPLTDSLPTPRGDTGADPSSCRRSGDHEVRRLRVRAVYSKTNPFLRLPAASTERRSHARPPLVVTVVASLLSLAGKGQNAIANARRHATSYLDSEYTTDPVERERIFQLLLAERDQIVALGPKYRQKVRDEPALMGLLERARDSHDAAEARGEAAPAGEPEIERRR